MSLIVVLVGVASAPAAVARTVSPESARLDHVGRFLTDAQGRVVVSHGLNLVFKRAPYTAAATGFSADDARFLARNGFTSVRLGLIWKAVEPRPGRYDHAYLASMARTVTLLHSVGIDTMLDFHQDLANEKFTGEGFPDWAIDDDGLPAQPTAGFPGTYLVLPALWRVYDHFWANDPAPGDTVGLQDRYAAAWRHVASFFADQPGVLGYDPFNEPFPGTQWPTCAVPAIGCPAFDRQLSSFYERVTAAIRTVDARGLVFYEPNVIFNFGAPTHVALDDPHAVLNFHDYCLPPTVPLQSVLTAIPCTLEEKLVFANAERPIKRSNDGLWLSEFGAENDASDLTRIADIADQHMTSWDEWQYCGCDDPTGSDPAVESLVLDPSAPPTGDNVQAGTLGALVRPYPHVVAGTPTSWSFDAHTGAFLLTYSPQPVGGGSFAPGLTTDVVVPSLQYPDGYTATVTGGHVVSKPDASVLRIVADAGPDSVQVAVSR